MAMLPPRESADFPEHHDINVTPFIDVILVLLIIFMVAAPLSTVSVDVDLPASTAEPQSPPQAPVILTLNGNLALQLGDERLEARADLAPALKLATEGNPQQTLFIRADKNVSYDQLMQLLNDLRAAGYLNIALAGLEAAPETGRGSGQ